MKKNFAFLTFLTFVISFLFLFFSLSFIAESAEPDPDLEKERKIGEKAVEQIEQQWPLASDPATLSKLEMIVNRLEPYMQRRIDWQVRLVNSEELNAFCLPGGFIFFTTGILEKLETDSELAAVMAHEMIHADRKHGLRLAAESQKVSLGALAVMILSGGSMAPMILAQMAQVAMTSSYTLELETEADRLGLEALIQSDYSPTGMITLFERFMAEEYKQPIHDYGIYMNHPDSPKRLDAAVKMLHEKKIPIERKYSLGLLRTSIKQTKKKINLEIDGTTVLNIDKNPENFKLVAGIKDNIDKYLQLELAPYELHIRNEDLYIGNHLAAKNTKGMTSAEDLRKNLLKAINSARAKHPTSKFFK